MSKELEAFKDLTDKYILEDSLGDYETIEQRYSEVYAVIMEALTELEELKRYPTSEEVCKALSELRNCDVYYNSHLKRFYHTHGDEKKTIIGIDDKGLIHILWGQYKSDFITLIGRFYEGLKAHNAR